MRFDFLYIVAILYDVISFGACGSLKYTEQVESIGQIVGYLAVCNMTPHTRLNLLFPTYAQLRLKDTTGGSNSAEVTKPTRTTR